MDLQFWTKLSKCSCDILETKQFLPPNLSISKNTNFLLLGITSRKDTKEERMAKLWPSESHFIIEGLAALREKPQLGVFASWFEGNWKTTGSTCWYRSKGYGHYKKTPPQIKKQLWMCGSWSPTGDVPPRHKSKTKISVLTTWTRTGLRVLSWLLNLRKILYICCAARAQHTPEQPRPFQLCCLATALTSTEQTCTSISHRIKPWVHLQLLPSTTPKAQCFS